MKNLTKKQQLIVDGFVVILKKYKHLGPLKLAELCSIAFNSSYEIRSNRNKT